MGLQVFGAILPVSKARAADEIRAGLAANMSGISRENLHSLQPNVLFEKLYEFSPDAIIVTDAEGRIKNVNAQVQRDFGYSREELIGKPVETLIPERFRGTHPGHRNSYNSQPSVRPMGAGLELYG